MGQFCAKERQHAQYDDEPTNDMIEEKKGENVSHERPVERTPLTD